MAKMWRVRNLLAPVIFIGYFLALQYHNHAKVVIQYKQYWSDQQQHHGELPTLKDDSWLQKRNAMPFTNSSKETVGYQPNSATKSNMDPLILPICNTSSKADWIECVPNETSIDVVLTVYKRNNLLQQLSMIASQTLVPSNIWVVQSEDHQDISSIVTAWNEGRDLNVSNLTQEYQSRPSDSNTSWSMVPTSRPPLHWLHFHVDAKYHGRFYVAYMLSSARYISFWDDDLRVGKGWLEHCVGFLQSQKDWAIVSGKGRIVQELPSASNDYDVTYPTLEKGIRPPLSWSQGTAHSVDFTVQHHTLRRELLRLYLASPVHTLTTGEDMQLNFALQQRGIPSYSLAPHKAFSRQVWASADQGLGSNGPHASWKQKPQEPRLWLLCKLAKLGFQLPDCQNCHSTTIDQCLEHLERTGSTMRHREQRNRQSRTQTPISPKTPREIAMSLLRQQQLLKPQRS